MSGSARSQLGLAVASAAAVRCSCAPPAAPLLLEPPAAAAWLLLGLPLKHATT